MAYFSVAGEGILDLAVGKKLLTSLNHDVIAEFDKRGKDRLDASLVGFARASAHSPWLVLRDLDNHACAPSLLEQIIPDRNDHPNLLLRVCVRSIEAWLLADQHAIASFLGLRLGAFANDPDGLANPKRSLIEAAAQSRRRDLREGITPRTGSGRTIGPEYNAIMMAFLENHWSLERALDSSSSLKKAHDTIAAYQV